MVKIEVKMPRCLRIFNIIIGIMYILISGALFYNLALGELTLLYFLVANLILKGVAKIVNGINYKITSKIWMIFNILFGIITLITSFIIIFNPNWSFSKILSTIAYVLTVQGLYRFLFAIFHKNLKRWAIILNLIIGFFTIFLSLLVIILPNLAVLTFIILLTMVFIINGILRILSGLDGYVTKEETKQKSIDAE